MIHHIIPVNCSQTCYPIYIGQNLLTDSELLAKHIAGKQVLIVTQKNIADLYLAQLQMALQKYQCDIIYIPCGETYKNINEWQKIIDHLVQNAHDRSTSIIALGGGMVGDMAGFAAACYMRGVSYLQIPTSLIAQVDAGIGGKTAVNHMSAKNIIGCFFQPQCVISDINVLQTLPQREFNAGLAEVVKYAISLDEDFFTWLENNITDVLSKKDSALLYILKTCSAIKANIVSQDEKETYGLRSILNFGHTFGHALETYFNYHNILHGEAVAIGMRLATKLSLQLGYLSIADAERIENLMQNLQLFQLSYVLPSSDKFIALMKQDKKAQAGVISFILVKHIGVAFQHKTITEDQLVSLLS